MSFAPLQIYENVVPIKQVNFTGVMEYDFYVVSGSQLLVHLKIDSIDSGADVEVEILNSFSADDLEVFDTISGGAVGSFRKVLADFESVFRLRVTVSNGNASFKVATRLYDNASSANLSLNLDQSTDSIAIGDGEDLISVNPDGSLNVNIVSEGAVDSEITNTFGTAASVSTGVLTTVASYTVPGSTITELLRVEGSGSNIALYEVYKNATLIAKKRTNFGSDLSVVFDFLSGLRGVPLAEGDVVTIRVLHNRPYTGNFEGRIQTIKTSV